MAPSSNAGGSENFADASANANTAPSRIARYARLVGLEEDDAKSLDSTYLHVEPTAASDEIQQSTWTVAKPVEYQKSPCAIDYRLFYDFQQDFEGWTRQQFQKVIPPLRKIFRDTLRCRGVYTDPILGTTMVAQLPALLAEKEPLAWPQEERDKQFHISFDPGYGMYKTRLASPVPIMPTPSRSTMPAAGNNQLVVPSIEQRQPAPSPTPHSQPHRSPTPQAMPQLRPPSGTTMGIPYGYTPPPMAHDDDSFWAIPPRPFPNQKIDAPMGTNFSKLWKEKESYTGLPRNILDDVVRQFLTICDRLGIRQGQFHKVFFVVLTGRVGQYYRSLQAHRLNFADTYGLLKKHFDTEGQPSTLTFGLDDKSLGLNFGFFQQQVCASACIRAYGLFG